MVNLMVLTARLVRKSKDSLLTMQLLRSLRHCVVPFVLTLLRYSSEVPSSLTKMITQILKNASYDGRAPLPQGGKQGAVKLPLALPPEVP